MLFTSVFDSVSPFTESKKLAAKHRDKSASEADTPRKKQRRDGVD
jgi:hypothetical protein